MSAKNVFIFGQLPLFIADSLPIFTCIKDFLERRSLQGSQAREKKQLSVIKLLKNTNVLKLFPYYSRNR